MRQRNRQQQETDKQTSTGVRQTVSTDFFVFLANLKNTVDLKK